MQSNKLIFFMLLASMAVTLQADEAPQKEAHNLLFDIHGVLLVTDKLTIFKEAVLHLGKTSPGAREKAFFYAELVHALCNKEVWIKMYNLYFNGPGSKKQHKIGETYINVFGELGYGRLAREGVDISNRIYHVNEPMIETLEQLKDNNIKLYLFSNIGPRVLKDAQDREKFKPVFEHFPSDNAINKEEQERYDIFKDQPAAYEEALRNTGCSAATTGFVDDKATNDPQNWRNFFHYSHKDHAAFVGLLKKEGYLRSDQ